MTDPENHRQQALEAMDKALAAYGSERLVLLAEALRLHALARESQEVNSQVPDDPA